MTHEERILIVDALNIASTKYALDAWQGRSLPDRDLLTRSEQMRELGHRLMTGEDVVA